MTDSILSGRLNIKAPFMLQHILTTNFFRLIVRKFSTARYSRILTVFALSTPNKVLKPIIPADTVQMTGFTAIGPGADESREDEFVYGAAPAIAA